MRYHKIESDHVRLCIEQRIMLENGSVSDQICIKAITLNAYGFLSE